MVYEAVVTTGCRLTRVGADAAFSRELYRGTVLLLGLGKWRDLDHPPRGSTPPLGGRVLGWPPG